MSRVGWRVSLVERGYKTYRRQVRDALENSPLDKVVLISGVTGVGKGLLLKQIKKLGGQILDLENAAAHYGSILGDVPFREPPSQK
jgi:tRNA 2-selenouridine synthase